MTLVFVLCKKYQILLKNVGEDLSIKYSKNTFWDQLERKTNVKYKTDVKGQN